eukprot:13882800-Heterocapsa_arctica.AAC.1
MTRVGQPRHFRRDGDYVRGEDVAVFFGGEESRCRRQMDGALREHEDRAFSCSSTVVEEGVSPTAIDGTRTPLEGLEGHLRPQGGSPALPGALGLDDCQN